MLCGPEQFFKSAKTILPWGDEPDSPQAPRKVQSVTSHFPDHKKNPGLCRSAFDLGFSPHSDLVEGWELAPKGAGVSIQVLQPSCGVGKILQHCKEWVITCFNLCLEKIYQTWFNYYLMGVEYQTICCRYCGGSSDE